MRCLAGELDLGRGEDHVIGGVRHQGVERHSAGPQVAQGVHEPLALLGQAGHRVLRLRRVARLGLEGGQELLKGLPGHTEVGL